MLGTNIVLGFAIGDYNGAFAELRDQGKPIEDEIRNLREERPRPTAQIEKLQAQREAMHQVFDPIERRALVHILFGVATALVAVLVNSISVTYFIGTSRWVREVVETYGFDHHWIADANRLKRRTFPWALVGMLTAVGIIALGAAAHPGTIRAGTAAWVAPHYIGALVGTGILALCYFLQWQDISANFVLIRELVAEVQRVRREKGLDVEETVEIDTRAGAN